MKSKDKPVKPSDSLRIALILDEELMGPYVLFKVVIPVILIVPIGSIFLAFLVSYGLMEGIGTLMEPIMRPIFKTPRKIGRAHV